jgi:hypothetical protein
VTTADTRRVSLVSWVHRLEASTTVVQDVAGWAQTWPTIHLSDFAPFLTSHLHLHPDLYYDYFNFRLGQWVAIPLAYVLAVVTDEPILLRRVDTVADDQHEVIASFARFVDQSLYPVQLPALNRKRQRSTTPTSRAAMSTSRQLTKKIKRERTYSSDDDLEVSEVTRMIKLEPVTPTARHRPSPGPPFTAVTYSSRRRLFSPSPPPVASSSRLPTSSSFEMCRATSSSPFPPTPSLYRNTYPSSCSSSSLASLSSIGSFTNPIALLEEEEKP